MFIVTDPLTFLPNYEYWSVCFKNPDPLLISVLNAGVLKHDLNTIGLLPFYCTTLCKNKFQTFWPIKIFKICKHRRPQLWYNIRHGISLLYEWSRNVGTFTGSITAPVSVVGNTFTVWHMLSVSDVTVGVWNSGDYTIELGVSRDLMAFL